MQYFKLIGLPDLKIISRVQILLAIALYTSAPAWLFFMLFGMLRHAAVDEALGLLMLSLTLSMTFAPKLSTLLAVLMNQKQRKSFGGGRKILTGAIIELIFSMLVGPIAAVSVTMFVLGLPFGRQIGWTTQLRESDGLTWSTAFMALWFHGLIGLGVAYWFWTKEINAWWIVAPFLASLLTAIPFAVITASRPLGRLLATISMCAIPEEHPMFIASAPALFTPFYDGITENPVRESF
jgi:membrane glycosyltransferase